MTLASKMRDRIQLRRDVQTPNDTGGFIRSYETLLELWAERIPLTHGVYIRGVQADMGGLTDEIVIRRVALDNVSVQFSKAFGTAFRVRDVHPLKSEFFVFVPMDSDVEGDLLRVRRIREVGGRRENLSFLCEEMEEEGTGY